MQNIKDRAHELLHEMLGTETEFRDGQWGAINELVSERKKVLLVQRTGWGKSIVYFIATKLYREQGRGPTLLISPLLSLMRDQIKMASRIGIRALTINSSNQDNWESIESDLFQNQCDIILISPERLNNYRFRNLVLPKISGHIGMFVIDEAHCISDWGHDFRPDYMRIVRILKQLPSMVPVLATTATANDRVIDDITSQLGEDLVVLRGSLIRQGLRLQNIRINSQAERLAWLVKNLPSFSGKSGIIYCQTTRDTERVAEWLTTNGFSCHAYHGGMVSDQREYLESAFKKNEFQIIVATVALGMGFDKPDVFFVIHFQCPGSVVHYYQQVGRAGRNLERSYGILLAGTEDKNIQDYFINSAFPPVSVMEDIIHCLEQNESLSFYEILSHVNASSSIMEKALKLLELEKAIGQEYQGRRTYFRTSNTWKADIERMDRIRELRRNELIEMEQYVDEKGCLMAFLQNALNDSSAEKCRVCANCTKKGFLARVDPGLLDEAIQYLKNEKIEIIPRRKWPYGLQVEERGITIASDLRNEVGRALCHYGDGKWGEMVRNGKYLDNYFSDALVDGAVSLIRRNWRLDPFPEGIVAIPSKRHPTLVKTFAARLAISLSIPFFDVLDRVSETPEQKAMQNSLFQAKNVLDSLRLTGKIYQARVLLVDDIIDSGWTLTMAGYLLRKNGSGSVYPFALAKATGRTLR